jgi:CRP/FNR family transcriptional regulator, nitrogen fixation regulation protein
MHEEQARRKGIASMVVQTELARTTRPLQGLATGTCGRDLCPFSGHPELVGTSFNYGHDEEIYGETEKALSFYKVVSGAVRTHKLLSDGRRQIGAFHFEGDLFGFETGEVHRFTAEAIVEATVLVFKRRTLEQLAARDLDVARWLWALTARNLSHAEEHMMLLGRKTATERVAAFLLEMDECMQPVGSITLPMPRRDIADYLGLSVETVSRTISQLQNEGAVELSGKREVTLHSRAKLRALRSEESWQ